MTEVLTGLSLGGNVLLLAVVGTIMVQLVRAHQRVGDLRASLESVRTRCECGHPQSFHRDGTGECQKIVTIDFATRQCGCQAYYGPPSVWSGEVK